MALKAVRKSPKPPQLPRFYSEKMSNEFILFLSDNHPSSHLFGKNISSSGVNLRIPRVSLAHIGKLTTKHNSHTLTQAELLLKKTAAAVTHIGIYKQQSKVHISM